MVACLQLIWKQHGLQYDVTVRYDNKVYVFIVLIV
jgi:hypothetical protein